MTQSNTDSGFYTRSLTREKTLNSVLTVGKICERLENVADEWKARKWVGKWVVMERNEFCVSLTNFCLSSWKEWSVKLWLDRKYDEESKKQNPYRSKHPSCTCWSKKVKISLLFRFQNHPQRSKNSHNNWICMYWIAVHPTTTKNPNQNPPELSEFH